MPSYLDLSVIGVVLVSAVLSMIRGFTREVLAIFSWIAAIAVAYYLHPFVSPYLAAYIHKPVLLQAASAALLFFATLIGVSLFTIKISDSILNSRLVGPLDRSLGFVFGAVRGFLLAVIAFGIFNLLVGDRGQPEWVHNAKTRYILTITANRLVELVPEQAASTLESWVKTQSAIGNGETASPVQKSDPVAPTQEPSPSQEPSGDSSSNHDGIEDLIEAPKQRARH